MSKHFIYTRIDKVYKKDAEGKAIPKMETVELEDGTKEDRQIPNQFEIEEIEVKDSFNIDYIIRTHSINKDKIIVLLDDGHEITEKTPVLRNPKKPAISSNITETKERVWVQSEISITKPEEIKRYFEVISS